MTRSKQSPKNQDNETKVGRPARSGSAANSRIEVRVTDEEKNTMTKHAIRFHDGDRSAMFREAFELIVNRDQRNRKRRK
jgi:hypothetical protein